MIDPARYQGNWILLAKQFLQEMRYSDLLFSQFWFYRQRRKRVFGLLREFVRGRVGFDQVKWILRYIQLPHDDAWYQSLFGEARVSGDVTPKYCELSVESIADVHAVVGD